MNVWIAIDGNGDLHGSFGFLCGKGGFVFYAGENPLPEPVTLVLVENGDKRPAREVAKAAVEATMRRMEIGK